MSTDVYFNCPACSHTILTEMEMVGQTVECPDCSREVKVPLIRDGVNPRLRETGRKTRRGGLPAVDTLSGVLKRAELVQKGMVSLERRQDRQNQKVGHLTKSLELITRQLGIIEEGVIECNKQRQRVPPPSSDRELIPDLQPDLTSANLPAPSTQDRIPVILSGLAILMGLTVSVWWILEL